MKEPSQKQAREARNRPHRCNWLHDLGKKFNWKWLQVLKKKLVWRDNRVAADPGLHITGHESFPTDSQGIILEEDTNPSRTTTLATSGSVPASQGLSLSLISPEASPPQSLPNPRSPDPPNSSGHFKRTEQGPSRVSAIASSGNQLLTRYLDPAATKDNAVCGKFTRHGHIAETYSSADAVRPLVCNDCWNGLFARDNFRDIWENPGVLSHADPMRGSFSYTSTWNRIAASSRGGCNWCSSLLSSVDPAKYNNYSEDENSIFRTMGLTIRVAFGLPQYAGKVLISAQLIGAWVNNYELFTYPLYTLSEDPSADEVLARDRLRRMKSVETCRLALHHMSYCLENHSECPKPSQDRVLPTRVVDCTNPERPRLYVTGGDVRGSYVALSYAWGEDQPNKTKRDNVDIYSQEINIDLLPQTTRDAIWATHAFGEKYLWIDALCIVQDSKEDKRREIAKIPSTFADASFTIIAARSFKASEGFLHDCPSPSVPIRRLPFPCKSNSSHFGTIYVEQDMLGKYDENCDVNDPVHKRAWCLEERLLSSRALVYTSNTLRFHCQINRINVGDAVRQIHDLSTHRLSIEWMPGPGDESFDPKAESKFDYNKSTTLWDNIVYNYTGRMVTQIEDRLIALAGVASRFGARWKKGEYLAGLWLDNLQHDLLWHMADGAQSPRPKEYRAPSWSWASVEGPVVAAKLHPHETPLYELKGHGLTLVSNILSFGGVAAAYLTLSARLQKATWRPDGLYTCPPQVEIESRIYYAWWDTTELCSADVWLLPICWRAKSEEMLGLVVLQAGGPMEYRRVGCFQDFPRSSKVDIEKLNLQDITLV